MMDLGIRVRVLVSGYLEWGGRRWKSMISRSVYARGHSLEAPSRPEI
jgi:hypothetical protein